MTLAETLRNEGRAEGRAEVLLQQIAIKFGTPPDEVVAQVRGANRATVDDLLARVLTARTMQELLG